MQHVNTPKPNLFIVGAPKCGTTALFSYLNRHPDFYGCPGKEPNYFSRNGLAINNPNYPCSERQYLELFSGVSEERWIFEATPWNMFAPRAAEAIHSMNPEARIICMVRNPVEAAYSLFYQLVSNGEESAKDFDTALALEENRRVGDVPSPRATSSPKEAFLYREVYLYKAQIERYLLLFGAEKVKIIVFDDLRDDAGCVARDVVCWLDSDPCLLDEQLERVNPNVITTQGMGWKLVNFGPEWLRVVWRLTVPVNVRTEILRRIKRRYRSVGERPGMSGWARRELLHAYGDEINSMRVLLGRKLSDWC